MRNSKIKRERLSKNEVTETERQRDRETERQRDRETGTGTGTETKTENKYMSVSIKNLKCNERNILIFKCSKSERERIRKREEK